MPILAIPTFMMGPEKVQERGEGAGGGGGGEGDNPEGDKEWKMKLLLKQVHPCNAIVYDTCVF